ncbi:hypothetical protein AHiyo6_20030 [Arthrobacter sp. Hiyo6]|nr:hypothetical protein AHiyo6_20030 [Arthrobacter sp. Hiyo6]
MSTSGCCTDDGGMDCVHTAPPAAAAPNAGITAAGLPSAGLPGAASPDNGTVDDKPASSQLPLLDLTVLQELEAELASPAVARTFARDYTEIWGQRYGHLNTAVDAEDVADALDAVISLKIASAMVGALRLAELAETVQGLIRSGDWDYCQELMPLVKAQGNETMRELQLRYLAPDQTAG